MSTTRADSTNSSSGAGGSTPFEDLLNAKLMADSKNSRDGAPEANGIATSQQTCLKEAPTEQKEPHQNNSNFVESGTSRSSFDERLTKKLNGYENSRDVKHEKGDATPSSDVESKPGAYAAAAPPSKPGAQAPAKSTPSKEVNSVGVGVVANADTRTFNDRLKQKLSSGDYDNGCKQAPSSEESKPGAYLATEDPTTPRASTFNDRLKSKLSADSNCRQTTTTDTKDNYKKKEGSSAEVAINGDTAFNDRLKKKLNAADGKETTTSSSEDRLRGKVDADLIAPKYDSNGEDMKTSEDQDDDHNVQPQVEGEETAAKGGCIADRPKKKVSFESDMKTDTENQDGQLDTLDGNNSPRIATSGGNDDAADEENQKDEESGVAKDGQVPAMEDTDRDIFWDENTSTKTAFCKATSALTESGTPMLQAVLVEDTPDLPTYSVYDALHVVDVPWYKEKRTWGVGLVAIALVVTLAAVLGTKLNGPSEEVASPQVCADITSHSYRVRLHGGSSPELSSTRTGVEIYLVDAVDETEWHQLTKIGVPTVLYSGRYGNWTNPGYFTCNFPETSSANFSIAVCPFGANVLEIFRLETLAWNSTDWVPNRIWQRDAKEKYWGIPHFSSDVPPCMKFLGGGGTFPRLDEKGAHPAPRPGGRSDKQVCTYSPPACLDEGPQITYENITKESNLQLSGSTQLSVRFRAGMRPDPFVSSTSSGVEFYLVSNQGFDSDLSTYEARMVFDNVIYKGRKEYWVAPGNIMCDLNQANASLDYSIIVCPFGQDLLAVNKVDLLVSNNDNNWESFQSWSKSERDFWSFPSLDASEFECIRFSNDGDDSGATRPLRPSNSSSCTGGSEHDEEFNSFISDADSTQTQIFRMKLNGGKDSIVASTFTGVEFYFVRNDIFDDDKKYESRLVFDNIIYDESSGEWLSPDGFRCDSTISTGSNLQSGNFLAPGLDTTPLDYSVIICPHCMDPFTIQSAEMLTWNSNKSAWETLNSWIPVVRYDGDSSPVLPSKFGEQSDCVRFNSNGEYSRPIRPMRQSDAPQCRPVKIDDADSNSDWITDEIQSQSQIQCQLGPKGIPLPVCPGQAQTCDGQKDCVLNDDCNCAVGQSFCANPNLNPCESK